MFWVVLGFGCLRFVVLLFVFLVLLDLFGSLFTSDAVLAECCWMSYVVDGFVVAVLLCCSSSLLLCIQLLSLSLSLFGVRVLAVLHDCGCSIWHDLFVLGVVALLFLVVRLLIICLCFIEHLNISSGWSSFLEIFTCQDVETSRVSPEHELLVS